MIKISNLNKTFKSKNNSQVIFKNFNLTVNNGEFLTILGPNGCGKSTLLNLITGIDNDYIGRININNHKVLNIMRIGYMLQKDLLLPWLTVFENIKIGADIQKLNKLIVRQQIDRYLSDLNIEHLRKEYPYQLSGGERQKVALIRTLVLNKKILLLDEPFSSIDYNTRIELQSTIFNYAEENDTTVILISHDIDEAIAVSDRIIILDQKPNGIKLDIAISLNIPDRNPINARKHPQFANYFSELWDKYPRK